MSEIDSIEKLLSELDNCPDNNLKGFEEILSRVNLSKDKISEIERICSWNTDFYTRNLIKKNDKYELIFLCWLPEQISPIHDHGSQNCWMKILQGECEEKLYKIDDENKKLKLIKISKTNSGQQSYINDNIALHSSQNIGNNKMIGVHLYLNPINTCYVYDLNNGDKKLIQTKYNSTFAAPSANF